MVLPFEFMTERYAHLAASQTAAYMPLLSTVAPAGRQVGPQRARAPSPLVTNEAT